MQDQDWPILQFSELKGSILGKFSDVAGESVCQAIVTELVENVDRPTASKNRICVQNDSELEWIMQVINHAFDLPFCSAFAYQTLSAAVRIYLAWMTSLTVDEQHACCPEPLKMHPDRYFRKMIEAFRSMFVSKTQPLLPDVESALNRQATEIRTVLAAIRHLTRGKVKDDFKDEVWSRSLLFLMAVCDQLLSKTKKQDEIGCMMSADLSQTLFDCWVEAALQEFIPSPSYWRTLSTLSWRWIPHVPLVECWARKLLPLTVLVVQKLYGPDYCPIVISDNKLVETVRLTSSDDGILGEVWLKMFQLLGNPAHFLRHSEEMLEKMPSDSASLAYLSEQTSLSFFLATVVLCKIVDIFYGDPNVSIDLHECEELYAQWQDACASLASHEDVRAQAQQGCSQRSSNLSSSGAATNAYQLSDLQASLSAAQASVSQPCTPLPQESVQHPLFCKKSVFGTKSEKNRMPNRALQTAQPNGNGQKSRTIDSTTMPNVPQLRAGQYVWWYMFENKVRRPYKSEKCPGSVALLEVYLKWLSDPALITLSLRHINKYSEDVVSQKSLSSLGEVTEPKHLMSTPSTFARSSSNTANGLDMAANDRRSFATQSTASSGDISSPIGHTGTHSTLVFEYPSVDGVSAGRAAALGQLCRIVCAKSSKEQLPSEQLAQFYLILHEAFLDRDRLMLCSLIYYSVDLFKLGLVGVEVLLPNYLMALDIVLTESQKLRLHPSVHEVEIRNACLRSLASIITWPSTFGRRKIITPSASSKLTKSSSTNVLESDLCYLDLRSRILRILVHTLRNETDPTNIHLTLSLCFVFCVENAHYDISKKQEVVENLSAAERQINHSVDDSEKYFTISALRGVVSAVCDNLSKVQWASDLPTCLAALDCLNCLATLPHSILFHQKELSTGSLIVSSLCRFVDMQLQKPPTFHSRDLHSSIVAAYYSLGTWLCAAPQLAEIESSLSNVAQIIEFGMTGGKGLSPENYKPASQRVHDAAENLLETLFSDLKNISRNSTSLAVDDEAHLLKKFGGENISLNNFHYFLLGENTIVGLHEAQHVHVISEGLPTVLAVFRTPFRRQHSSYFQLIPKVSKEKINQSNAQSPGSYSAASGLSDKSKTGTCSPLEENTEQQGLAVSPADKLPRSSDSFTSLEPIKQFEFPIGINKPQCKLDAEFQPLDALEPIPEVSAIQEQLNQIRLRLDKGAGSALGDRDARNVWVQSSLGAFLSQPPRPEDPVAKCNSLRVFLYDMGLINRKTFGKHLIPLNTVNIDLFRQSLHSFVDRAPVKLLETVSVFYVRDGQRSAAEILKNNTNLPATSREFCSLLCALGKAVDVGSHAHWTGHWETAFLGEKVKNGHSSCKVDDYTLDGTQNVLWWANNQVEVAYVLPTERSKRPSKIAMANGNEVDSANGTKLLFSQTSKQLSSQSFKLPNLLEIAEAEAEPKEKEDMLVFRPRPSSPFPLDSQSRETYLNESFEQLSALEEEYKRLSANPVDDSTPNPDSKDMLLQPADHSRRLSHGPQISSFNLFSSLSPISLLVDEENPAPKPMLHSLIDQLSTDSAQSDNFPKIGGSGPGTPQILDLAVPSYTTTIITASTNTMSMMQATAIVVRSARFSPHRRQHYTPLPAKEEGTTLSLSKFSYQQSQPSCGSSRPESPSTKSSQLSCSSLRSPSLSLSEPKMHPPIRRQSMAATAPTVVAFSPFTATPIEFPKCPTNTCVPLRSKPISENSDGEEEEEEDFPLALLPSAPPPPLSSKNKVNSPGNRRKSLVKSALAFATIGKKSAEDEAMKDGVSGSPAPTAGGSMWSRKFSQNILTSLSAASSAPRPKKGVETGRNCSITSNTSSDSINNIFPSEEFVSSASPHGLATYSYIKSFFRRKAPSSQSMEEKDRHKIEDVNALEEKMGTGEHPRATESNNDLISTDLYSAFNSTSKSGCTHTSTTLLSPDSDILETCTTTSRTSDVSQKLSPVNTHPEMSKSSRTKSSSTLCSEKRNSMGLSAGDKLTHKRSSDQRIFVVWLECIEDMYYFPYDQLLGYTEDGCTSCCAKPDCVIIYLHILEPGLVRVQTDGMWTKYGQPGPLMDGMIVSSCSLAPLIQQTVCSIARRKVIEIDNYQMVHTRRRHSILEFGKKFALRSNYTDFLEEFIC